MTAFLRNILRAGVIAVCAFSFFSAQAEGTKQLSPIVSSGDTSIVMLRTNGDSTGNFAEYDGSVISRLNIRISDFNTDTVYIGLSREYDDFGNPDGIGGVGTYCFRIKDPTGTVVHGPFSINSGTANADSWDLAQRGPDVLDPLGYSTAPGYAMFLPAMNGDYYIEFTDASNCATGIANPGNPVNIKFFDITVVNSGAEVPGRLWSFNWALISPPINPMTPPECQFDRPFDGVLYSYTTDGFVSRIDFDSSGFQGLQFNVAFGERGPRNTGDVIIDRKSVYNADSTSGNADHRIFINDPDNLEFPSSTNVCGDVDLLSVSCVADSFCFNVGVTQPGVVEIILDFDGDGGFTEDSIDVLLAMMFPDADTACIGWNGLMGDGSMLAVGDDLPVTVRYSQGVQHYAAYDVELLKYGFCVETVRPICPGIQTDLLFWDDSELQDDLNTPAYDESDPGTGQPIMELNGCQCGVGGCRTWTNVHVDADTSCTGQITGYGDRSTLNTWWYANTIIQGPLTLPFVSVQITGDSAICSGDSTVFTAEGFPDTISYTYEWSGPGGFMSMNMTTGFISDPGVYYVTITDTVAMCSAVDSQELFVFDPPVTSITFMCVGPNQPNADIDLTVMGAGPPFTFLWSNGAMTEDLFDVPPGQYSVMVTDTNGCVALDTILVEGCCALDIVCPSMDGGQFACVTDVPAPDTTVIIVNDYCDPLMISSADVANGGSGCAGDPLIITRTYTITDGAMSTATCVQVFTVIDDVAPSIVCPPDITVDCDAGIDPMLTGSPVVADNCSDTTDLVVSFSDNVLPGDCVTDPPVERTWMVTDECGNTNTCVQIITVQDTVAPVVDALTCPSDTTIDCDAAVVIGTPAYTDNCSGMLIITFEDDSTGFDGTCAANILGTIARTFYAEDACGNIDSSCVVTVSIQDTVAPTFTTPGDVTLECLDDTSPANTGDVTDEADNCTGVVVDFSDMSVPGDCPAVDTIYRTWTATDSCGNQSSDVQVIIRFDFSAPTFTTPADVTIDCDASTDPTNTGEILDTLDACGSPIMVAFNDVEIGGNCDGESIIERTWTVSDECGNSATDLQIITLIDTLGPSFTVPADTVVDCPLDQMADYGSPIAISDNCSASTSFTFVDNVVPGECPATDTLYRTWIVSDDCLNSTTAVQTITFIDTIAPSVVECPLDAVIDCNTPIDTFGLPLYDDACSMVTITFSDDTVGFMPPGALGMIVRTFYGEDACGNIDSSCIQNIVIQDTIAPEVLTCPGDIIVDCAIDADTSNTGVPTYQDNCFDVADLSLTFVDDTVLVGGLCLDQTITRTFYIADPEGNVDSSCVQVITVEDNTPPTFTTPADITIDCDVDIDDLTITGEVFNVMDCNALADTSYTDTTPAGCNGTGTVTRTWVVTDVCGNSASADQIIVVQDTTGPTFTVPADVTISCDDDPNDLGLTGDVTDEADNCGPATVSFTDDLSGLTGCSGTGTIVRTWTATDDCGNTSSQDQLITTEDLEDPTIECPADITITNIDDFTTDVTGVPTTSDNCGTVTTDFVDNIIPGECPEAFVAERTWTATDECGNTATCLQIITSDAPCGCDLVCPPDMTINLDPGACTAIVSYNYPLPEGGGCPTDVSTPLVLTQNTQTDLIQDALACTGAGDSHWRAYDLSAMGVVGDFTMESLGMASWSAGTVQVFVYTYTGTLPSGTLDPAQMTLVGQSAPAATGAFNFPLIPLVAPVTIPANSKFAVEQRVLAAPGIFTVAGNYSGNTEPAYFQAAPCGFAAPTSYEIVGFGNIHPIQVLNGTVLVDAAEIIQISGLPPGSEFPIGTTTNCFQLIDNETGEVVDSCCFDIVVIEHPFSVPPACNDLVQISLDQNCQARLCADVILEGGPYGCYDDYIVNVDQYGPDVNVNCIDIELTPGLHTVTVIDPETGISCWGEIIVEDKLPPQITCMDFTLTCGQDLTPIFTPPIMGVNTCATILNPGLPIGPNAGVITTSTCTVSLPQGVEIIDVNVCVKITHTWIGDCNTDIISPTGAVTNLWGFGQCGPTPNMHQKFDDAGPQVVACADINNGCDFILQPVATQLGTASLDQYIATNPNGTWTLMITDNAGGDGGTLDEWYLEIEYAQNAPFAPTFSDNCDPNPDLQYTDVEMGEICDSIIIERTWVVTDDAGNTASCIQTLTIEPLTLAALECPANYEGECGSSSVPDVTGWPTIDGVPIVEGGVCNIFVGYWDKELQDCGNGTKIIRTWTILDWCTQEVEECVQIIKLADEQAPVLTCPPNQTVNTDPWFCNKDVNLQIPNAVDLCGTPFTLSPSVSAGTLIHFGGNNYRVDDLPVGTHTVTWTATDNCGNSSTCTYTITVEDMVPPVPICDEHTIVTITFDNGLNEGLTKAYAETFDDGSHDNCGPVTFLVRRMDSCIDFDWIGPNGEYPNNDGGPPESIDRGLTFQPWVPFACCDVGNVVMVELRVTDLYGNINSCMVEVTVQDKLPPFITCPPDITVSCEFWFDAHETNGFEPVDGLESVFGKVLDDYEYDESDRDYVIIDDPGNDELPQPYHWGLDGWADDNCDVTIDVRTRIFDDCSGDDLPAGAPDYAVRLVERTFRAQDGQGNTSTCRQRIWVVDFDPFFITDTQCGLNNADDVRWPCDLTLTDCPENTTPEGLSAYAPNNRPQVNDDNCSIIGVTYDDQIFYFVDGACYKIVRTWTVIDWCQYDPVSGEGYWQYIQVIKVNDQVGPEFLDCPSEPVTLCVEDEGVTLPENNQVFLGEDNPNSSACSVHLNITRTVFEACSDEVIYDVKVYPNNGSEFIQVVAKTHVPVDSNNEAVLTLNTRQSTLPSNHPVRRYGLPYNDKFCSNWPLPGGTKDYHRVLWTVEDGCGNQTTCSYLLRLEDCKKPTPICVGLSSVVMPSSGCVTIWAKDFDSGSSVDDCTAHDDLLFSFSGDVYEPSRDFCCDDIETNGGPTFLLEIWVADEGNDQNCNGFVNPLGIEWSERNKDYCTTFITIDDNEDVCPGGIGVGGHVETELIEPVERVKVDMINEFGQVVGTYVTNESGTYHFFNPLVDHTVTPIRNDDHKNGVSTLDLVAIQKHLLGIELLNSPYKLIAADANNTSTVSALDLVEIRKLILGQYVEFPNNTSWRFVDASFDFDDPANPWPFPESIVLESGMTMHEDFIGMKVGDVNGSVRANLTQVQTRGARKVLNLSVEDREVRAGERVDIEVHGVNFTEIFGYQLTLEHGSLQYEGVRSGALVVPAEFVAAHDGAVTMSWANPALAEALTIAKEDVLFTLTFTAQKNGMLSEMLSVTSAITEAEGYRSIAKDGDTETDILDIALVFGQHTAVAGLEYALYQNEPNPFSDQTIIGFDLPEAMAATVTVFDMHGRIVYEVEGDYAQGFNQVVLKANVFQVTGAYYYRLTAGDFTASKKFILAKE